MKRAKQSDWRVNFGAAISAVLPALFALDKMRTAECEVEFVRESNRIEGIHRDPTDEEVAEHRRFLALKRVTVKELQRFVKVYQPDAVLRDKIELNVRVGSYVAPSGGIEIRSRLNALITYANNSKRQEFCGKASERAFDTHIAYEQLHPFTDGNGRSGRVLWAWQMPRSNRLGFLHAFYYQTLNHHQNKQ